MLNSIWKSSNWQKFELTAVLIIPPFLIALQVLKIKNMLLKILEEPSYKHLHDKPHKFIFQKRTLLLSTGVVFQVHVVQNLADS